MLETEQLLRCLYGAAEPDAEVGRDLGPPAHRLGQLERRRLIGETAQNILRIDGVDPALIEIALAGETA